jgi:hypothetical protein
MSIVIGILFTLFYGGLMVVLTAVTLEFWRERKRRR